MKPIRIVAYISILFFAAKILTAQESGSLIITRISDNQVVEINAGKSQYVEVGQVFNVLGTGQYLNPGLGRVIQSDRLVLAQIRVTEVRQTTSLTQVISSSAAILVGHKVERSTSESTKNAVLTSQPTVDIKKPVVNEMKQPITHNTSENIIVPTTLESKVKDPDVKDFSESLQSKVKDQIVKDQSKVLVDPKTGSSSQVAPGSRPARSGKRITLKDLQQISIDDSVYVIIPNLSEINVGKVVSIDPTRNRIRITIGDNTSNFNMNSVIMKDLGLILSQDFEFKVGEKVFFHSGREGIVEGSIVLVNKLSSGRVGSYKVSYNQELSSGRVRLREILVAPQSLIMAN